MNLIGLVIEARVVIILIGIASFIIFLVMVFRRKFRMHRNERDDTKIAQLNKDFETTYRVYRGWDDSLNARARKGAPDVDQAFEIAEQFWISDKEPCSTKMRSSFFFQDQDGILALWIALRRNADGTYSLKAFKITAPNWMPYWLGCFFRKMDLIKEIKIDAP